MEIQFIIKIINLKNINIYKKILTNNIKKYKIMTKIGKTILENMDY